MTFQDTSTSLRDALQQAADRITGESVSLRQLIAMIGEQGLLVLCALLTVPFLLPVSIPGMSTVFGLAICLISVAIITNRPPWLPERIMDRPLDAGKLTGMLRRGISIATRMETLIRPRMPALTSSIMNPVNGCGILLGAILLLFPLGLVPFSNTLPAFAILCLCLGMSQRDGAVVLLGYAGLAATILYFSFLAYAAVVAGQGLRSLLGGG